MSSSLYELTEKYTAALDFLTDPENEVDQQTIADTIEGLDDEIEQKLINVGKFIVSLEHQAEGIYEAEKRLEARRKALDNKADWLRDYVKSAMERTGKSKLNAPDIALSLVKMPPSVIIDNENKIPAYFWKSQPPKLDKSLIKESGGCPGTRVESAGYRVSIK